MCDNFLPSKSMGSNKGMVPGKRNEFFPIKLDPIMNFIQMQKNPTLNSEYCSPMEKLKCLKIKHQQEGKK
jgi:hypothetical protein